MSVMISVIGSDENSDEYLAARKLKRVLEDTLPSETIGEIVLVASATLLGQEVKDIDILMMGILQNCKIKVSFNNNGEYITDFVDINSFCTTIELKSHDISGILRKGTDFYVKYGHKEHNATQQSNQQKISAMNFFSRVITNSPFITNIIWFNQILRNELRNLVSVNENVMPHNVLASEFDFKDLVQVLVLQRKPYQSYGKYKFDSNYSNASLDDFKRAISLFSRSKAAIGELTRIKIEQITNGYFNNKSLIRPENKFSIYRGRAGTGKTIGLIQAAIKLVEEKEARVIILTYNKALVSDLRRLFAFAELPDMFAVSSIAVNTMQSFFYKIINQVLYDNNLDGLYYINNYETLMQELLNIIETDKDIKELVREICADDMTLNWDYVLIDEAQDWSIIEKDLILSLYDKEKIIVADGGQQFVRNVDICDWTEVQGRKSYKLKLCLRQKGNLIRFLNVFSDKTGNSGNTILSTDKLPGGKIIVLTDKNQFFKVYQEEMEKLKKAGNMPYDMLLLVPHTLVSNKNGNKHFKDKTVYENNGVFIWDGSNEDIKNTYPIETDVARLLQYDSSRGLEAWTVFCLDFDKFIKHKATLYDPSKIGNSLMLESKEDQKKRYILNWTLIPLTRAIDTIVITLNDVESEVGKILKEISEENTDYVIWV